MCTFDSNWVDRENGQVPYTYEGKNTFTMYCTICFFKHGKDFFTVFRSCFMNKNFIHAPKLILLSFSCFNKYDLYVYRQCTGTYECT